MEEKKKEPLIHLYSYFNLYRGRQTTRQINVSGVSFSSLPPAEKKRTPDRRGSIILHNWCNVPLANALPSVSPGKIGVFGTDHARDQRSNPMASVWPQVHRGKM